MPNLDDTDLEILQLLVEDGRRPFSEIADRVDLTPPTVSDRVDRLKENGVIRQFTVDVDRATIQGGTHVLVECHVDPGAVDDVREGLTASDAVEHVYVTADARVIVHAMVTDADVRGLLASTIDVDHVREYDVSLLADSLWKPHVSGEGFSLSCAECGNTVDAEGTSVRLDGDRYHFCCSSCESRFVDQYESLKETANV